MIPWPLVFAGIWLATLMAWVGVLVYDELRDREVRVRIAGLGDGELPRPSIAPLDEFAETDREWCSMYGIAL